SIRTFEMLRRPDTVRIIGVLGDRIVTLDEQQPGGIVRKGCLPGGRVDPSDPTVVSAARREFLEETGYVFETMELLDVVQPEPKIEWFVHTFVAQNMLKKLPPISDPGERITVGTSSF